MKRRASLLFGLGVLVSLSMSVLTYAATDNTQSIAQTQEAQQNEEGTETSVYKISEKTENGRWQLLKQDGAVVTERTCFYIMGEYCYYVDTDGYICTGFVDAAADETTGNKKAQFPCFFGRSSLTSSHSETRIPIAFFCMPDLRALPLRFTCTSYKILSYRFFLCKIRKIIHS